MPVLSFPSAHINDEAASQLPAVVLAHLCGENDENVLSAIAAEDLVRRDFLYTLVLMCGPDRPGLAIEVNNLLVLDEIYEVSKLLAEVELTAKMDIATAVEMADREDALEVIKSLLHNDWLGHAACGYMLRFVVSHWQKEDGRHLASISQAAGAVEEWCAVHQIYGAKRQNLTRTIWKKYRTVCHLWAALDAMTSAGLDPTTPNGFLLFCGTAQWLLECGATIVPKGRRAGEAILRVDEGWAIPESHLQRGTDGTVVTRIWSNDIGAHDIRDTRPPPRVHPV